MSLSIAAPLMTEETWGTVRRLTLYRSDTRGRIAAGRCNTFCIRLHFVLEERIGVGKIGAE